VQVQDATLRRPTGWIISPFADMILIVATPLAIVPFVALAGATSAPLGRGSVIRPHRAAERGRELSTGTEAPSRCES
jgi:hypothetical protein